MLVHSVPVDLGEVSHSLQAFQPSEYRPARHEVAQNLRDTRVIRCASGLYLVVDAKTRDASSPKYGHVVPAVRGIGVCAACGVRSLWVAPHAGHSAPWPRANSPPRTRRL